MKIIQALFLFSLILPTTHLRAMGVERRIEYMFMDLNVVETTDYVRFYKGKKELFSFKVLPNGELSSRVLSSDDDTVFLAQKKYDVKRRIISNAPTNGFFVGKSISVAWSQHGRNILLRNHDDSSNCILAVDSIIFPSQVFQKGKSLFKFMADAGTLISGHGDEVIFLTPIYDENEHVIEYRNHVVHIKDCKISVDAGIASEDIDNFFEFGSSVSGRWLLGSALDEFSILILRPGKEWYRVKLPGNVHNVLSAYWGRDGEFWILANVYEHEKLKITPYKVTFFGENPVVVKETFLGMPKNWFEAIRAIASDPNH